MKKQKQKKNPLIDVWVPTPDTDIAPRGLI